MFLFISVCTTYFPTAPLTSIAERFCVKKKIVHCCLGWHGLESGNFFSIPSIQMHGGFDHWIFCQTSTHITLHSPFSLQSKWRSEEEHTGMQMEANTLAVRITKTLFTHTFTCSITFPTALCSSKKTASSVCLTITMTPRTTIERSTFFVSFDINWAD